MFRIPVPKAAVIGTALLTSALLFCGSAAAAEERRFALDIRDGAIEGETVLTVNQGDQVIIEAISDRAMELHLHGYDIELDLPAGEARSLEFLAAYSGRFPMEAHGSDHEHATLLYLEVYPQ